MQKKRSAALLQAAIMPAYVDSLAVGISGCLICCGVSVSF